MRRTILLLLCVLAAMEGSAQRRSGAAAMIADHAADVIAGVVSRVAPDRRTVIAEFQTADSAGVVMITGKTSEAYLRDSIAAALSRENISFADRITLLPSDRWAQVRIPVACIRTSGSHAAEMSTQAIMGTPMRLLEDTGEWQRIQTPDGYIGYMNISSIAPKSDAEMNEWRHARRLVVTSPTEAKVYSSPTSSAPRETVTELVNASIVEGPLDASDGRVKIALPDGRTGWVDAINMTEIGKYARQDFSTDSILNTAYRLMGAPYLWGGASTKSVDCSGLIKVSYLANGIILMRDASQQIFTGIRIEPADTASLESGDLLFFSHTPEGRIGHVAMYDRDGHYIHSSGRVKVNVMRPDDEDFGNRVYRGASRIKGAVGTKGITRVEKHPWYFNK